jgi:hypothetical protein
MPACPEGHRLENTVRYLGIEIDAALEISEQTEVWLSCNHRKGRFRVAASDIDVINCVRRCGLAVQSGCPFSEWSGRPNVGCELSSNFRLWPNLIVG